MTALPIFASPNLATSKEKLIKNYPKGAKYALNKDIAFISVLGSRPDIGSLQGFQRAVLFNAQGVKVKEIYLVKSDSIYFLDKMLQETRGKGPLIIHMYR